ncbi:MAG: hypothetical protein IKZ76_06430, partial [Lachnospiraceae bacterium]|nr:hypothetical protein [Lachnospiraceae bacterium]
MKRIIRKAGLIIITAMLLTGCVKSVSDSVESSQVEIIASEGINEKREISASSDCEELVTYTDEVILSDLDEESISVDDYNSLVRHFEIIKEERENGYIYVCVDGMDIYKYAVKDTFFDEKPEYVFEIQVDNWGTKTIAVFLDSGENRRCIGGIYRESNYGDTEEPLFFGSGMCNENIELREEIEYDTVLYGYLKDFNFEEGSVKIDYATDIHMSPSGGMSLIGNDGVFEDAVVSPDVRFAFFFGIYNEVTVKGFKDRMNRDTDSSMGYSIYFKNGEVV